jgi:hypothetical protein
MKDLDLVVEHLRRTYERTGNPLCVWQARVFTRKARRPTPAWVEDYLDKAGKALLEGTRSEAALGLAVKGGHGKHLQFSDARRDVAIVNRIDFLREWASMDRRPGRKRRAIDAVDVGTVMSPVTDAGRRAAPDSMQDIITQVAEETNLSRDRVEAIWKRQGPKRPARKRGRTLP